MIRNIAALVFLPVFLLGCVTLGADQARKEADKKAVEAKVAAFKARQRYQPSSIAAIGMLMEGYESPYILNRMGPPDGEFKNTGTMKRYLWLNNPAISDKKDALKNDKTCLFTAFMTPDLRIDKIDFYRASGGHCDPLYNKLTRGKAFEFSFGMLPYLYEWAQKKDFSYIEAQMGPADAVEDFRGRGKAHIWVDVPEGADKATALKDRQVCKFRAVNLTEGVIGDIGLGGTVDDRCTPLLRRLLGNALG